MKKKPLMVSLSLVLVVLVSTAATQGPWAFAFGHRGFERNIRNIDALLTGYEEVPALSTPGNGSFRARISRDETRIDWVLSFGDTETPVTQAHIHFNARALNGPIIVFFCTNLGNGPAGTQACPADGGEVRGSFVADDVGAGGAAVGIAAGELDELIAAIRAGATYANVHTTGRAGGEIRGQIAEDRGFDDHDRDH
jgi:hypothetical protein